MSAIGNNVRVLQQLPAKALSYQQAIPVIKTIAKMVFAVTLIAIAAFGLMAGLIGLSEWQERRRKNECLKQDIISEIATEKFEDLDSNITKDHPIIQDIIKFLNEKGSPNLSTKTVLLASLVSGARSQIAQAVSCETNLPIIKIEVNGYHFRDKILGAFLVSSSKNSPSILLVEGMRNEDEINKCLNYIEKLENKNKIAVFFTLEVKEGKIKNKNVIYIGPPSLEERKVYFENILIDQAEKLERIAQETDGWSHSQFKELLNTFKSGDDIEKSVQKQNLEIKKKQILAKLAAQARLGILPKTLSEEKDGPGVFLEPSNVAFTDIAGNEAAKDKFAQIIQYFTNFEIYKAVMNSETDNVNCLAPKGVILYGPPGTGKTKLIEALANEIKFPVLSVKGSLQNKYIGESAENIRRIFKQAKSVGGPCILFIDEIDSMGKRSGGAEDASANAVTQMINTFLAETNELEKWPYPIIIIGATNRIEAIDDALKRPGRFDALIEVCLPDATTREAILKIHAQKFNLSPDLNFQAIAEHTSNFSGAHLEELVKTAARCAIDDRCARLKAIQTDTSDIPTKVVIEQGHLETALKTVRPKQETKPAEDADALMNVLRDALLLSSK